MAEPLSFPQMRTALNLLADHAAEYAGLPMPIDGEKLVIHKSYPFAEIFKKQDTETGAPILNRWPCRKYRGDVVVFRDPDSGRPSVGLIGWPHPLDFHLKTMGVASCAYDITCEMKAMEKLQSIVTPHAFRSYMISGCFLETSKRSKVTYLFRRLRPTIAVSTSTGSAVFLAALCLHPIGYYADTWAGCMVPTDEVVSHLMMMRGDEHGFWKQANQHPSHRPEAGL